jgi:internalin A
MNNLQILSKLEKTLNIEIPKVEKETSQHHKVGYTLNDQNKVDSLFLDGCAVKTKDLKLIGELTDLRKIDLSNNQISKIKNLNKLTNLIELKIENNQIIKIQGLDKLTNLIELNLINNQTPYEKIEFKEDSFDAFIVF